MLTETKYSGLFNRFHKKIRTSTNILFFILLFSSACTVPVSAQSFGVSNQDYAQSFDDNSVSVNPPNYEDKRDIESLINGKYLKGTFALIIIAGAFIISNKKKYLEKTKLCLTMSAYLGFTVATIYHMINSMEFTKWSTMFYLEYVIQGLIIGLISAVIFVYIRQVKNIQLLKIIPSSINKFLQSIL